MYLSAYECDLTVRFDKQFANDFLALQLLICLDTKQQLLVKCEPIQQQNFAKMRTILDCVSLFAMHFRMNMIFFI